MMISSQNSWKALAWNGISLRVPPQWEVSLLDTSYLQLDDGMGPVMEIKWRRLSGSFSHQAHLRKLAKLSAADSNLNFQQIPLSEEWRQALRNFESRFFKWRGLKIGGEGAIIYCTSCQKATLVQFYHKSGRDDPSVTVGVLNSLRDHSEDGWVEWAVFGLRALMPERFDLLRHNFRPGHYLLVFRDGQESVYLSRWGPAGVLLEDGDLQRWFEKECRDFRWCSTLGLRQVDHGGNPTLKVQSQRSDKFAARLWARVTGRSPHFWVRIWHLRLHNHIMGVGAHGLRPLDEPWLEEICRNYAMV